MTTIIRAIALSVLTLLAAGVPVIQPAGAAAPIKKCGNLPSQAAYDITSKSITCKEAKRVVRGWNGRGNVTVRGLACRYRDTGYESGDIRCAGSRGRVVHWQTGV